MYIFAEPMAEEDIDKIQNSQKAKVAEYEREVMGLSAEEDSPADEAVEFTSTEAEDQATTQPLDTAEETLEIESGTLNVTGAEPTNLPNSTPSSAEHDTATEETSAGTTSSADPSTDFSSQLNTSDAAADIPFLSFLAEESKSETTASKSYKPLLAFTLTTRSRVNGAYVERPVNLSPTDEWQVEYSLAEISTPERAWALYEATKFRRRKVFDKANKVAAEGEDGQGPEKNGRGRGGEEDGYITMLRGLSQKGRDLRAEIDAVEADMGEKIVFGEPFGKLEDKEVTKVEEDVDITGVDDYTRWLFGQGVAK